MSASADRWIRRTTTGCVAMLALIAGTVSYLHMHTLVELHGQPGWVAALTPLSVDGMIVAASTALLADSRSGGHGGFLPWALLTMGSVASLAANVAVAEPTVIGRIIAAWPSFALIGAYEMLMRQVRHRSTDNGGLHERKHGPPVSRETGGGTIPPLTHDPVGLDGTDERLSGYGQGRSLQRQAWQWALDNRTGDGSLPSGREIAQQYGRHERWGRLVKRSGIAGEFAMGNEPVLRLVRPQAD
jgi:hypothetical protein